ETDELWSRYLVLGGELARIAVHVVHDMTKGHENTKTVAFLVVLPGIVTFERTKRLLQVLNQKDRGYFCRPGHGIRVQGLYFSRSLR
ncbi:MAG TPA: hypothetical protein PK380_04365, partial [Deltaproteobacteria bacterium]|nr:hypothetical protein [Deltaproteobacteria bacterium]